LEHDHDTRAAWLKMALAWVLTTIGNVTLQHVATGLAIIYTVLQIYVLVRDRILRRRAERDTQRGDLDEPT
jgi:hypothetical protein